MQDSPNLPPIVVAGAGVLKPLNPYGLQFRAVGGTQPPVKEIIWQTEGGQSVDLEVMIRVLEATPGTEFPTRVAVNTRIYPALRWQIWSHGHGQLTLDYPPPVNRNLILTTQTRVPYWPVPARGVAVRLNARHVRLQIACEQPNTAPLVEVSIQPMLAGASAWRPFPIADVNFTNSAGLRSFFPPHATEWKLLDTYEDAAAQTTVDPQSPVNLCEWSTTSVATTLKTITAYQAFEWSPIPGGAHSWQCTPGSFHNAQLQAVYR